MIKNIHSIPLKDLEGNSLANTAHVWEHGGVAYTYKRNSDGYRSEEFQDRPRFLFAGCSETFGESAEYETTWAYKLFNKVKNQDDHYCNVGLPGLDVSLVIHHILLFINKYGIPQNLFIMFPQFNRALETDRDNVSTVIYSHENGGKKEDIDNIVYVSERLINSLSSVQLLHIKNLENFCKLLNINLFWSTWCQESGTKVIDEQIFNNYVNVVNEKNVVDFALMYKKDIKDIEISRTDKVHHGEIFHDFWSDSLYNKYMEQ